MPRFRKSIPVLLAVLLLLSGFGLVACSNTARTGDTYQATRELARTELWKQINEGGTSSASIAVLDQGDIVYSEGFGMADRLKSTPVTSHTLFNIGSTSKTFNAVAIMQLVDDGMVDLDAPVTQYLPEFTMADPRYEGITVRMLLNHQSGMPGSDYANNLGYGNNPNVYPDTLAVLSQSHLKAAPGEAAPYCNDGFTLAEIIVARVSGQDYLDYLKANISEPLSLDSVGLCVGERPSDPDAFYYPTDTGKAAPLETAAFLGAGGLAATAEDLVRFADSFSGKGPQILSQGAIAEMTRPSPSLFAERATALTGENPEMSYGLGLDVADPPPYKEKGITVIGKGGDTDDYHSMLVSAPDQRISVAVLEAGHGCDAPGVAFKVLDSVLREKGLIPAAEEPPVTKPPEPQPLPADFAAYEGYWIGSLTFRLSVDTENDVVNMITIDKGVETSTMSLQYLDGHFVTASGKSFSFVTVDGTRYLTLEIFNNVVHYLVAQQLPPIGNPVSLQEDINGKQWLRRNVMPVEKDSMVASTSIATSFYPPALPGYLFFMDFMPVTGPDNTGLSSPYLRDLRELTLFDVNGHTWARLSDLLYSPVSTAAPLAGNEQAVIIGDAGYGEWLTNAGEAILGFEKPEGGRVAVFSSDGSVLYDSAMQQGEVYVPAGGLIEMAGVPGDVFQVTARPAAGT